MLRVVAALLFVLCLTGCQSQMQNVPREIYEGDHETNFRRVFKKERPSEVTILNSIVVGYVPRKKEVVIDDFEMEMVAPMAWITKYAKTARLSPDGGDPMFRQELLDRRDRRMRSWYTPKPIDAYQVYRGGSGHSEIHMLIDKVMTTDGRYRVFISRH